MLVAFRRHLLWIVVVIIVCASLIVTNVSREQIKALILPAPLPDRLSRAFSDPPTVFLKEHSLLQQQLLESGTFRTRYVVWLPIGGFGNRIYGLLSTLLYAKITSKAFFIGDWTELAAFYDLGISGLGNRSLTANLAGSSELYNVDACWQHYDKHREIWLTSDLNTSYPPYHRWRTNCPFWSYITFNPHYSHMLSVSGLLLEPSKVPLNHSDIQALHYGFLGQLMRQYLRPHPFLLRELEEILLANASDVTCLIGVQIRVGGSKVAWYDPSRMNTNDIPKIWACMWQMANGTKPTHCTSRQKVRFFLATDAVAVQEEAKKEFGDMVFFLDSKMVHVDRGNVGWEGLHRTIMDVEILALCDDLLISYSTYGCLAASRRDVQPYRLIEGDCIRDPLAIDLQQLNEHV